MGQPWCISCGGDIYDPAHDACCATRVELNATKAQLSLATTEIAALKEALAAAGEMRKHGSGFAAFDAAMAKLKETR